MRFNPHRVVLEAILAERTERKSNCSSHTETSGDMFKRAIFTQNGKKVSFKHLFPRIYVQTRDS